MAHLKSLFRWGVSEGTLQHSWWILLVEDQGCPGQQQRHSRSSDLGDGEDHREDRASMRYVWG